MHIDVGIPYNTRENRYSTSLDSKEADGFPHGNGKTLSLDTRVRMVYCYPCDKGRLPNAQIYQLTYPPNPITAVILIGKDMNYINILYSILSALGEFPISLYYFM